MAVADGADAGAVAGLSRSICSFVSGPQRYDIAQRVASSRGEDAFADTSRNWRFPRPPIALSSSATSVDPAAERRPSSTRALSFSVCRRPTSQVPAFDIAL